MWEMSLSLSLLIVYLQVSFYLKSKFSKVLKKKKIANSDSIPVIYAKVLLYGLLPYFLIFLVVTFWGGYYILKKRNVVSELIGTQIISLFFIHPSVINILTSTVSCTEIDPGQYYVTSNLYFQCSTDEHNAWVIRELFLEFINFIKSFAFMYPSLVIWIAVFPLTVLYYLRQASTSLSNAQIKKRYGFLYQGYKDSHYYW